jgi:IS605 OrfB family transposase
MSEFGVQGNKILDVLVHGYEGYDDGLFGRLSPSMPKKKFDKAVEQLRNAILLPNKTGSGYALRPRVFAAPLTGNAKKLEKTGAAEAIRALKSGGVLPMDLGGKSTGERFSIVEGVIRRFRGYVKSDISTMEEWAERKAKLDEVEAKHARGEATEEQLDEAREALENKRERANFSKIRNLGPILSSNNVGWYIRNDGPYIELTIREGAFKGTYRCSYGSKKDKCYLDGLKIEEFWDHKRIRGGGGKKTKDKYFTGNFVLTYKKNGLRPRKGILREPYLHLKTIHKREAGRNVSRQVIQLVMPIDHEIEIGLPFRGEHCQFSRHYPKPLTDPVPYVTVMGVDLGLNPTSAYAVVRATYSNPKKSIPDVEFVAVGKSKVDTSHPYAKETRHLKLCRAVMRASRGYHFAKMKAKREEAEGKEGVNYPDPLDREFVGKLFEDPDVYLAHLDSMPDDRREWTRRTTGWVIGGLVKDAQRQYGKFVSERRRGERSPSEEIMWAEYGATYRSFVTSFFSTGKTDEDRIRDAEKGETVLKRVLETTREAKKDARRKEARAIADLAQGYECDVVAVENLDGQRRKKPRRGQKVNDKVAENRRMDLWSPKAQLEAIQGACFSDGVGVVAVRPDYTSQYVCHEGVFGYRDSKDKKWLYYRDSTGQLCRVDSDINAAKNIAYHAVTRNAFPFDLFLTFDENGKLAIYHKAKDEKEPETEEEEKKRKAVSAKDRWLLKSLTPAQRDSAVAVLKAQAKKQKDDRKEAVEKLKGELPDKDRESLKQKIARLDRSLEKPPVRKLFRHGDQMVSENELNKIKEDLKESIPKEVVQTYRDHITKVAVAA